MKKTILSLAIATGLISFAGTAKSENFLNFNFYSYGTYGSMTGEIFGLTDNSTSMASYVELFTLNGVTVNITLPHVNDSNYYQIFTVNNGVITAANYNAALFRSGTPLSGSIFTAANLTLGSANSAYLNVPISGDQSKNLYYQNNNGFSAVTYSAATVPEPSIYALFGIGAIGLLLVMRRKNTA